MISKYLTLPVADEQQRQSEILDLALRIYNPQEKRTYDPDAWLFPLKDLSTWMPPRNAEHCVYGFGGTAPIMIVGDKPSTHVGFNGKQAKIYYGLLEEHGLQNAHLTDCLKTDPNEKMDQQIQANIFAEELRIIKPFFILAFNDSEEKLKSYLRGYNHVCRPHPMPHYTLLRYPSKVKWWRAEFKDRLAAMLAWAEVLLEPDEGGFYRRRPQPPATEEP